MPDISMCFGKECPKMFDCYRFTAKPSEYRQSYFVEPPYDKLTGQCEFYWPKEPETKVVKDE